MLAPTSDPFPTSTPLPGAKPGDIVPRDTILDICRKRDAALALYRTAHASLTQAAEDSKAAYHAMQGASARKINSYNVHHAKESSSFHTGDNANYLSPFTLPTLDDYAKQTRIMVDRNVWAHVIELTGLEMIMDKTAKDDFRKQLSDDPPECTVDNVTATLHGLMGDAGLIFQRGMAKCFSALDRRFRSHDAFKIGARVILNHAFDGWGMWSHYSNQRDSMIDIERVFAILDGKKPESVGGGIVHIVETERRNGNLKARQSEHHSDYFTLRVYKNGNLHIWFKRDDLVEKVNKLLHEYYGEVIPDAMEPEDDGGLHTPKTSLAKNYGFFPTPDSVVERVLRDVPLHRSSKDDPPLVILEPSAGTGQFANKLAETRITSVWSTERDGRQDYKYKHIVDCIEIHPDRAHALRMNPRFRKVTMADFLAVQPVPIYDRIVMNPPFDRERDIDHVMHALKFLKPGGHLTAIMSAGTEFRQTRKSIAFRKLMDDMKAQWEDLPAGSFSSVGTNINTRILRVWKKEP